MKRERRRPSALADQLRTQGYAILSREVAVPASAAPVPAPTPPPALTPPPVSELTPPRPVPLRFFDHRRVGPVERPRLSLEDQEALREDTLGDWSADMTGRDALVRPRRRGGLVASLVAVAALAGALIFFATQAPDRLTGLLIPAAPPAETTAPADRATPPAPAVEEPARVTSRTRALTPPAPSRAAPSAAKTSPTARDAAPAEPAASSSAVSLPPRRTEEAAAPQRFPLADTEPVRSQKLPDFPGLPRVEVSRAPSAEGTTFTVKLADPRGRPVPDAQVWLRQKTTDGIVRETPLEPVAPAGSYRGAVPGAAKRADELTVRVVLGDRRMEMPIAE